MKKTFKVIGFVIAAIIVLIAISFVTITILINPNDFKGKISQVVQQKTGREFTIGGNISWRFFPWLGVKAENITLGNASGFTGKNFAEVGELDVSVRFIPLIFGEIKTGTLQVKNANLYLTKDTSGRNNWDDLLTAQTASAEKLNQTASATNGYHNLKISIGGAHITNTNLYWNDQQADQTAELTRLDFYSSSINLAEPIKVKSSFNWQAKQNEQKSQGSINLKSVLFFDPANQNYKLTSLNLTGTVKTATMANTLAYKARGNFDFDIKNESYTAENFKIAIANLIVEGKVISKKTFGTVNYQGNLSIPKFNPTELLNNLGINYQPQDSSAFKALSAEVNFQGPITAIKAPDLQIVLDRSVLHGSINNLNLKQKNLNFNLALNEFNLNRYLPKTITVNKNRTAKPGLTQQSANTKKSNNQIPAWVINGDFNIGQLTFAKIRATKVVIPVKTNNGIYELQPKANFYNGTFNGQINIDLRGSLPKTTANLALAQVSLEPLLSDLTNSNNLSGTANFKANISTIGSESPTILKNLNGKGSLEITSGALNFMDINSIFVFVKNILDIAVAPINIITTQKLPTFKKGSGITKFDSLTATYVINNGIISNRDLLLTASSYQVTGQGTVNLVSQQVNYLLNASTAAITINKQNLGLVQIPIKVSGTFNNLHYYPDTTALIKSLTVGTLQNVGKTIGDTLQKSGNVGQNLKDVGKNIGKSLGF